MMADLKASQSKRRTKAETGSFVLSYLDVADLLHAVSMEGFLSDLTVEIERAYQDPHLESITRTGWSRPPDTLEIMGCQSKDYTCVKLISSNPSVASRTLPTVTGTIVCTTVGNDQARLVCDAAVLTPIRTAASTAVILRRVLPSLKTLGIVGAGLEGTTHAFVLSLLLNSIEQVFFTDIDQTQAKRAAKQVQQLLNQEQVTPNRRLEVSPISSTDLDAIYGCDAIVTATYGTQPVISDVGDTSLRDGSFIAAVGADLVGKRELEHSVYDHARFIADDLGQCLREGELQHAANRLRITNPPDIHRGVLADGRIVGAADFLDDRNTFLARDEPVIVYDSTGFSGQDLAVARVIFKLLDGGPWVPTPWNPPRSLSLGELISGRQESVSRLTA